MQLKYYILLFLPFCFLTCTQDSSPTLFQLLPSEKTGIDFSNKVVDQDSLNIIQYLYFYNGGGVSIGDINNDGLPDIFFSSNMESNKLYLNKGNLQFEDITEKAGISSTGNWSTGVNMVDINADGWLDIYVCQVGAYKGFQGKNQLFINEGKEEVSFIEKAAEYGLNHEGFSTQSAFFDYDLDGDLDMYLLCHSVHSSASYRDTSTTRKRDFRAGDKLFRNDLNTTKEGPFFTEVSEQAGIWGGIAGYGLGIAVGDIDKNGCPDIYVGNDFHENDFLYLNNCDGTFSERSSETLAHTSNFSMGNDLADFNNDGWLDLATMDMKPEDEVIYKASAGNDPYDIYRFKRSFGYDHQLPRNMLQLNKGASESNNLKFSEIGQIAGISATDWSWSALIADFDNDGWKDIHITNGIPRRPNDLDYLKFISNKSVQEEASDLELAAQMPDGKVPNYLFANNQNLGFDNKTNDWGLDRPSLSNGAAYGDLDLDGDLDLVVNNMNETAFVYENKSNEQKQNNYISLHLKGKEDNPFAIGAKVQIHSGKTILFQELSPVRGWQSSVDYNLHFGLGSISQIDSIVVVWNDGYKTLLENIQINQLLSIPYSNEIRETPDLAKSRNALFEKIADNLNLNFNHKENRFYDNGRESLIPHLLSTEGPGIAVGDVNGDELEDFFIGGASGQKGALFLQNTEGNFQEQIDSPFHSNSDQEDICAAFLDVDQDGDLDLFVGSGGNEFYHSDDKLLDRLYLNNGDGNFQINPNALPKIHNQTSCVKAHDFDQDGDLDLFVGNRSRPVNYGMPTDNYLLENDGKGHFTKVPSSTINLEKLGMVTDATWTDFDQDGDIDLVVVGEWMPLTIFENKEGTFEKTTLPNSNGWWNTIEVADVDQDGDEDWLVGNFGLNSNLKASANEPLQLYIGDYDKNLSKDPILTHYRNGKEYPFAHFDELGGQLVFLKKRFRQYQKFANSTIKEVFTAEELNRSIRLEVNNFNSVFVRNNNGKMQMEALPFDAQIAPVQSILIEDFDQDGHLDALLGGNFHEMQPSIGRMDASYGSFLKGDGKGNFQSIENRDCGLMLEGAIRDLKKIKVGDRDMILVGRNDASLEVIGVGKSSFK